MFLNTAILKIFSHHFVFLVLLMLLVTHTHADLLLTAPPRESAQDGLKVYGPLADELSRILNEKVTYEHPKGWLYFQRDLRADKFDIIFDGPHFISWRIEKFNHTPIAKLPGTFGFIVITAKGSRGFGDKEINDLTNLYTIRTCVIAPPNLSTLSVLEQFKNPFKRPRIVTVKGGMKGVYESFKEGKCKAAILRDKFYLNKIPQEERDNLKIIFKTKPFSNQGITVGHRVNPQYHEPLRQAFTGENEGISGILRRFAPKAKAMQTAAKTDYQNYYKLLTEVIYGWDIEPSK